MNLLKKIGTVLAVVLGVFLILRAAAEPFVIHPGNKASYEHDWGGPTYIGATTVHMLPGIIALVLLVRYYRNRKKS